MQRPVVAIWSLRAHDESAATMCRLHAVGSQLQTVEQRSTALSGAGVAEERPRCSLFFMQGKAFIFVTVDPTYTFNLILVVNLFWTDFGFKGVV